MYKLYGGQTALVRVIPVETKGVGGRQIEVTRAFDSRVTASNAGYLLDDILS
jgi:hypothetical protein